MIPVICRQTMRVGSMIQTDPGSRSLGSGPGIRFRDPRTCLIEVMVWNVENSRRTNHAWLSSHSSCSVPWPWFRNHRYVDQSFGQSATTSLCADGLHFRHATKLRSGTLQTSLVLDHYIDQRCHPVQSYQHVTRFRFSLSTVTDELSLHDIDQKHSNNIHYDWIIFRQNIDI